MTILAIAQSCAKRLMITSPSSFIGSTDNNMILLLSMIDKTIDEIRDDFPWPELEREYTFTLVTSTASYALPGDYDSRTNESIWNRTQALPLIGPLSASEWQLYKSGLVTASPRQRYRVKGSTNTQMFIDPTPSSDENGETIAYEYLSTTARRPKTWVASTAWAGIQYCWYNGNIYDRGVVTAATTGTTAPTHVTSSASDGTITWTYVSAGYPAFDDDTDEVILQNSLIIDGAVWRFKRERGLDYQELRFDAEKQIEDAKTKLIGASTISVSGGQGQQPHMIGLDNYPEQDF